MGATDAGLDRKRSKAIRSQIRDRRGVQRYVITSAQNATPVNAPFLASLLGYCKLNGAQLIVVPYRYKNPTSVWSNRARSHDWWASELQPYLLSHRVDLNPHLVLLADVMTQPTATSPLSGFETDTGPKSAIIGHPKLQLKTIATPQQRLPKILTTTGAVTEKNYIPSKAGKKAEHHHTFGAAVVEIKGGTFHLRQLNATRDGSFCDLKWKYSGAKRKPAKLSLIMGDTHVDYADPGVVEATFGRDGIVSVLQPEEIVWHDVLDFQSRSHHNAKDPFIDYAKYHAGMDSVEAEIDRCFAFIDKHTPAGVRNVIVASNHHEHLARWVREANPKADPVNAVFWAKTYQAMCEGAKMVPQGPTTIDPFAWWAQHKLKCIDQTRFLRRNESHLIAGIEVGFHGDQGANGSRGSLKGYGKIGVKTVTGHSHSPGIEDGAVAVGASDRHGRTYKQGPCSELHTHCLVYENGKRSLINIIDGTWHLP